MSWRADKAQRAAWVEEARAVARELAAGGAWITVDMVRERHPLPPNMHGTTVNSVFRGEEWQRGPQVVSAHPGSLIHTWRLRGRG